MTKLFNTEVENLDSLKHLLQTFVQAAIHQNRLPCDV
jgi:hypothetical protein